MSDAIKTFGKYEIKRVLGQGGFGIVYQAYDTQLTRDVALKVLHQNLMTDARFIDKAQKEAGLVKNLDHPNIVKVLEVGEVAGRAYIAMEYIESQTLTEWIKSGRPPSVEQVLIIIEQVAAALDYAHSKKLTHRDIKPDNLLVDSGGNVHLVDFGLAHAALSSTGASTKSVGLGTAMYMSPEQAAGQIGDRTTDVYSLGVIAYELLTGQLPFHEETLMGYMMAHKEKQPPLPGKINPHISRHVQRVLLRSLSKEPGKRYKSAGDFAKALRSASARPFQPADSSSRLGCVVMPALLLVIAALAVGTITLGIVPLPPSIRALLGSATPTSVSTVEMITSSTPAIEQTTVADTRPPTNLPTTAPIIVDTATNIATALNTATNTPMVSTSTHTPQLTDTLTPTPTSTATPTVTPLQGELVQLSGTGVVIESLGNVQTQSGQGRLIIRVRYGTGKPVIGQYVALYSQKQDLSGQWVVDKQVADGRTDNSGLIQIDVAPDHYIVSSNLNGYNWGNAVDVTGQSDIPVDGGQTTQLTISLSRLTVGFLRGDNSVISGQYVAVWRQKKDLAGQWVTDQGVADGRTDNTGKVSFDLTPGYYVVGSTFAGYNWGTASDVMGVASVPLKPGEETQIIQSLGQLTIGLVDPGGKPLVGQYLIVYKQKTDVTGNQTTAESIGDGRTDNTGTVVFNLTPGKYAIQISDRVTYNVLVEAGRITFSDGVTSEFRPK